MRFALALVAVVLAAAPVAAFAHATDTGCGGPVAIAAGSPLAMPPPDAQDLVLGACWGAIRPGALMSKPVGCTMNWVLKDESGGLYVGTAGHCTSHLGQTVGVAGVGDVGPVVFRMNGGVGYDFALIRIDPALHDRVDPTLCRWGGPTHEPTFADSPIENPRWLGPDPIVNGPLLHYGWGANTNEHEATRARAGYAVGLSERSLVLAGNYNPGDSGSPVMFADGAPAGIVTHSMLVDPPGVESPLDGSELVRDRPRLGAGLGYATRFDFAVASAGAAIGQELSLVTSAGPLLSPLIDR